MLALQMGIRQRLLLTVHNITNLDKVIIGGVQGNNMNRRTAQNQRKVRMPSIIRRRPKKETVEKPVAETTDASCQTTGCGCGN